MNGQAKVLVILTGVFSIIDQIGSVNLSLMTLSVYIMYGSLCSSGYYDSFLQDLDFL